MVEADGWSVLDAFLPGPVRTYLEERFWRPIQAQATLEALWDDPAFLTDPGTHPAMFADHGVVHVRDVSIGLVRLVDTIDGVLLPGRPPARRRFVETIGVAAAYLHDIGMVDMTPKGRRDHPLFAAHAAFGADVTPLVDHLLAPGPVRARLDEVAAAAPFATTAWRRPGSIGYPHSRRSAGRPSRRARFSSLPALRRPSSTSRQVPGWWCDPAEAMTLFPWRPGYRWARPG